MDTETTVATRHLDVPGARLHYEVRGDGPLVVLIGSPMDATAFAPLAELLAGDHTVLTTDPRGINRSTVDSPDEDSTIQTRADDLSRLITDVDAGPAVVVGSSGGAVAALALVEAHPEQVHTVVAHEPPLNELVDDRDDLRAQTDQMVATYLDGDIVGAWKLFMAAANIQLPPELFDAMFGGPRAPQQAADERFQFVHMLRPTTRFQPDIDRLRSASTRIVIGIGDASADQLCDRTARALAALLGLEPTLFPGGHTGFLEDTPAFAARLRAVLAEG